MPSDPRIEVALQHLSAGIDGFRSTVASTAEEVRGYLTSRQASERPAGRTAAVGLGKFAAGRIDYDRFAALMTAEGPDDPATLAKLEKAFDVLRTMAAAEADLFHVHVASGKRLYDAVADRLAQIGRGFAAARLASRAARGSLNSGSDDKLLAPLGFERWNGTERGLAPPLVVEVEGTDLRAGELAEFVDGAVKIVLVVRGPMAPAPLVRLITPSTFVLQTESEEELARVAEVEGPAVAALVSKGAARFVHDPRRGPSAWERIELLDAPANPKKPIGGQSVWQQVEELEQLKALARRPEGIEGDAAGGEAPLAERPVDKLAAWLLSQADLKNLD